MKKLCECGCGMKVKPGRRFIQGHNLSLSPPIKKGTKLSEETIRKRRETRKINKEIKEGKRPAPELPFCKCGCGGRVSKPGNIYICGHHLPKKGKKRSVESRLKQGESLSEFYQTERGIELRVQKSENWKGEKNIAKKSEVREKISKSLIGDDNPSKRPEVRKKMSEKLCERWQDPEFVKIITDSWKKKPNQPEKGLDSIVQFLYPNEYKYNGNYELGITIGGKIPDFVNVNGKKKAIDLFGDYWHKGEDPQVRIDLFKEYGWDLLVIWEHELKDKNAVIQKILKFHGVNSDFVLTQKTLDTWVDNNKREGGDKN